MPDSRDEVVCLYCGRKGQRGFTILSGDPYDDAGRVTYRCTGTKACQRRRITGQREQWFVLCKHDRTGIRTWEGPYLSRREAKSATTMLLNPYAIVKAIKDHESYV